MTQQQKTTLAELLLRRKELNVLYNTRAFAVSNLRDQLRRRQVSDEVDQLEGQVSLVDPEELEKETNYYAHQRRLSDSVVQQANWTTTLEVPQALMDDENTDGTMSCKLAELLVRRKELDSATHSRSVDLGVVGPYVEQNGVWKQVNERIPVEKGLSELYQKVERKGPSQIRAFMLVDTCQKKLRLLDTYIQKTNWDTVVEVPATVFEPYQPQNL